MKFIYFSLCFLLAALLTACPKVAPAIEPEQIVKQNGAQIEVTTNTDFFQKLKIKPVEQETKNSESLRSVGQIVALGEAPASLLPGQQSQWIELETSYSRSIGLNPSHLANPEPGLAIGLTWLSKDAFLQTNAFEKVNVYRYGLKGDATPANLIFLPNKDDANSDRVPIAFIIRHGSTWYPGTTCFVEFPLLRVKPTRLPMIAILHEGVNEYVFREKSEGHFEPVLVTIARESSGQAEVISDLKPGDRVVEAGAILLKPFLADLIEAQKEHHHAP